MAVAKTGDMVKVHYSGRLDDGSVFDSSEGRDPLAFTLGRGDVIPGFDSAVLGMEPGEKKTVSIPPEDAYGERREELVVVVRRDQLPADVEPVVGTLLQMTTREGAVVPIRITGVGEDDVTLDANPPLAGERLTFEIELIEISA